MIAAFTAIPVNPRKAGKPAPGSKHTYAEHDRSLTWPPRKTCLRYVLRRCTSMIAGLTRFLDGQSHGLRFPRQFLLAAFWDCLRDNFLGRARFLAWWGASR